MYAVPEILLVLDYIPAYLLGVVVKFGQVLLISSLISLKLIPLLVIVNRENAGDFGYFIVQHSVKLSVRLVLVVLCCMSEHPEMG